MAASIHADPQCRLIRAQGAPVQPARAEATAARPDRVETANITLVEGKKYKGDYAITPGAETQTLATKGLFMTADVTVGAIPPATTETIGGVIVGEHLQITENGVLSVTVANDVERDNTNPITAAAVYTEVGNINALLATI